jgi:hypothetical protein
MSDSEMREDDSWGCEAQEHEAQEHEAEKYGDGCHTFSEHETQEHRLPPTWGSQEESS